MELHPAILTADYSSYLLQLANLEPAQPHFDIDIIDWDRTPSKTITVTQALSAKTNCKLTLDLMVNEPAQLVRELVQDPRVDTIVLNLESRQSLTRLIDMIHMHKKKAGLSVNPDRHFYEIVPYLPELDMIQIFTVEPGAQGGAFLPERLKLAQDLVQFGFCCKICADGGINAKTIQVLKKFPIDILSCGSALSKAENPLATYEELTKLVAETD